MNERHARRLRLELLVAELHAAKSPGRQARIRAELQKVREETR